MKTRVGAVPSGTWLCGRAEGPECLAEPLCEQRRLGHGGEVAAPVVLVPGGDREVPFGELPGGLGERDDLAAEDVDGGRHGRGVVGRQGGRRGVPVRPVRQQGGRGCPGRPVQSERGRSSSRLYAGWPSGVVLLHLMSFSPIQAASPAGESSRAAPIVAGLVACMWAYPPSSAVQAPASRKCPITGSLHGRGGGGRPGVARWIAATASGWARASRAVTPAPRSLPCAAKRR